MKQQDVSQTTLLKQLMIQDKMRGFFMCEENGVGESQVAERQRKRMCERWSVQEGRISMGERSGHSHSNGRKRNIN